MKSLHTTSGSPAESGIEQNLIIPREIIHAWSDLINTIEDIFSVPAEISIKKEFRTEKSNSDKAGIKPLEREEKIKSSIFRNLPNPFLKNDKNPYVVFPVKWPNGDIAGSIITGFKQLTTKKEYSDVKKLVLSMIKIIESDLNMIYSNIQFRSGFMEFRNAILGSLDLNRPPVICSYCKKIRGSEDYWKSIEDLFQNYYKIHFSHGICPDCSDEIFREINSTK